MHRKRVSGLQLTTSYVGDELIPPFPRKIACISRKLCRLTELVDGLVQLPCLSVLGQCLFHLDNTLGGIALNVRLDFARHDIREDDIDTDPVELPEVPQHGMAEVTAKLVDDARIKRYRADVLSFNGRVQLLIAEYRHLNSPADLSSSAELL
jgi:hypothetical protein